jgi:hypothetical protein
MKSKLLVPVIFGILSVSTVIAEDLPLGVPNPINPHGEYNMHVMDFTTPAYRREALKLVLTEANKVALELTLPEKLPITQTDLTEVFIGPFGQSYAEKRIGNVSTKNFRYCVSQGNKFSYLEGANIGGKCRQYQASYTWPAERIDTNGAYEMATNWLAAISVDVDGLNREHHLLVEPYRDSLRSPPGTFVPVYKVSWCDKWSGVQGVIVTPKPEWWAVASVVFFLPTKELLELRVEDPKYILRPPLAFTNLEDLLVGPNCGVSRDYIDKFLAYSTPTNLALKIAAADRIVITNHAMDIYGVGVSLNEGTRTTNHSVMPKLKYEGFGMTLEGAEVEPVVHAYSYAKLDTGFPLGGGWNWQVRFYQGTNELAITALRTNFFIEYGEYRDESGVLKQLWERMLKAGDKWAATNAGNTN